MMLFYKKNSLDMKATTFAQEAIRKKIKEKMEMTTSFQDYQEYYGSDYNDCHSDYFDSNA